MPRSREFKRAWPGLSADARKAVLGFAQELAEAELSGQLEDQLGEAIGAEHTVALAEGVALTVKITLEDDGSLARCELIAVKEQRDGE